MVIASSPQEKRLTRDKFTDILRTVRRRHNIIGLVLAFQHRVRRRRNYMMLEDVIEEARNIGEFNIFVFVLHPPYQNSSEINLENIRGRLAELDVVSHILDARRFAFLNALEIKNITGMP